MSTISLPQPAQPRNPAVVIPAGQLPPGQLPGFIQIHGQTVYSPIVEGDTLVIDTGIQILDLDISEIAVLRAVLAGLEVQQ